MAAGLQIGLPAAATRPTAKTHCAAVRRARSFAWTPCTFLLHARHRSQHAIRSGIQCRLNRHTSLRQEVGEPHGRFHNFNLLAIFIYQTNSLFKKNFRAQVMKKI
jgi:hypothetical protein